MFIILLAHTPGNYWARWIPARFGFSDATEIFVFCSGMASALAFGAVFDRSGFFLGCARVIVRVWQVYWAHIGLFFVVAFSTVMFNMTVPLEKDYISGLALNPFFNDTTSNLIGLMTLTYVPNYFDILPMYLVILAMIPAVMALARIHPYVALGALATLWVATNIHNFWLGNYHFLEPLATRLAFLHLPAQYWFEPPSNVRVWFFNPFGWQLVFFTGFALMRGWLPAPPVTRPLILIALAIVLLTIPLSHVALRTYGWQEWLGGMQFWEAYRETVISFRGTNTEFIYKTDFGIMRYVHFLALAYLAWVAVGPMGARLQVGTLWPRVVGVVRKVGQQSLAVFLVSMVIARYMGVAFDLIGNGPLALILVNSAGFGILIATAYLVGWIKGQPWRAQRAPAPAVEPRPNLREAQA
ncbi:MAG: OpgC domain-containing protein [Pseudomonadota bacterium]